MKTLDESFRDWEGDAIGYGYGTGEPHTVKALKELFGAIGEDDRPDCYNFKKLEAAVTPTVAWLLIAVLCRAHIFEYGTSPRFGWLTEQGKRLRDYIANKSEAELLEALTEYDETYVHCYPDACNCGPDGYEQGRKCQNPFWE